MRDREAVTEKGPGLHELRSLRCAQATALLLRRCYWYWTYIGFGYTSKTC